MILEYSFIENVLKEHLQKNLVFSLNGKNIKRGKFILFKITNFYIDFHLFHENSKKQTNFIYSIPCPYDIKNTSTNEFIMDYSLSTLAKKNNYVTEMLKQIVPIAKNKYYNNILKVKID